MRRREFIGGLAGAVGWPLVARAQQPSMPVIGFLRSSSLRQFDHLIAAFRQGLKEIGFVEGLNVTVDFRSAEDRHDQLSRLVADLIDRPVDVVVGNVAAVLAAKAATKTIPIVFTTGGDPIREGLVASLSRPGGNVTGVTFFGAVLGVKRLELLREVVPKATIMAMLVNQGNPSTELERRNVQAAAQAVGQQLTILDVDNEREIEEAFATALQRGAGALLVGPGAFLNSNRERIVALAALHRLPTSFAWREAAEAGALMSYGTSQTDAFRQAGVYAARILKGEKPGDLPVLQPAKFELIINLKTAKTLGIDIPLSLLRSADEVVE